MQMFLLLPLRLRLQLWRLILPKLLLQQLLTTKVAAAVAGCKLVDRCSDRCGVVGTWAVLRCVLCCAVLCFVLCFVVLCCVVLCCVVLCCVVLCCVVLCCVVLCCVVFCCVVLCCVVLCCFVFCWGVPCCVVLCCVVLCCVVLCCVVLCCVVLCCVVLCCVVLCCVVLCCVLLCCVVLCCVVLCCFVFCWGVPCCVVLCCVVLCCVVLCCVVLCCVVLCCVVLCCVVLCCVVLCCVVLCCVVYHAHSHALVVEVCKCLSLLRNAHLSPSLIQDEKEFRSSVVEENGYCPEWDEAFEFTLEQKEFDLLCLKVFDKGIVQDTIVGQAAIPLPCLRQGYRNIDLRDESGRRIASHPTLFLQISQEPCGNFQELKNQEKEMHMRRARVQERYLELINEVDTVCAELPIMHTSLLVVVVGGCVP